MSCGSKENLIVFADLDSDKEITLTEQDRVLKLCLLPFWPPTPPIPQCSPSPIMAPPQDGDEAVLPQQKQAEAGDKF